MDVRESPGVDQRSAQLAIAAVRHQDHRLRRWWLMRRLRRLARRRARLVRREQLARAQAFAAHGGNGPERLDPVQRMRIEHDLGEHEATGPLAGCPGCSHE